MPGLLAFDGNMYRNVPGEFKMTLQLALVGCGGMGFRHTRGFIELASRFDTFRLAAVCDVHEQAANHVATAVEDALGYRPKVYTDFARMLDEEKILDAVDITTDTRMHHTFALAALEAGLHVMTEKPMAITLKACRTVREVAEKSGLTFAVAENFRRDPMNRLAKALIENGAIGDPTFVVRVGVGGGTALMHNTGWRALKSRAGSHILENGVHDCDLLLYFLGDINTISAETGVLIGTRRRAGLSGQLANFYEHRVEDEFAADELIKVDTEDSAFAVIRFASGVIGQVTMTSASQGYGVDVNTIHGTDGTLLLPQSRSGRGPEIRREGRDTPIRDDELLELVPDFQLDDATATFWGGQKRIASYDMTFQEIDGKLIAIEYQDFGDAILAQREPEVGVEAGMKALAFAYGLLESGHIRQPVRLDDVLTGKVSEYQQDIDDAL
jgi:predicted dehydrogenase